MTGWIAKLPHWVRLCLWTLCVATFFSLLFWAVFGGLNMLVGGFVVGLISGPALYIRRKREFVPSEVPVGEYPRELEALERRHLTVSLLMMPLFVVAAYLGSLVLLGEGFYGIPIGVIAAIGMSTILSRFGGPDDPRWKRARDKWKQQRESMRR